MLQIIVCNFEMHFICTMDFEYEVQFVKFSICYILLTCSFFWFNMLGCVCQKDNYASC